jgi:hypothetical protein
MNEKNTNIKQSNPYIGPLPYQKSQKDLFFGRDQEAEMLLSMVISERVLLFYAQTGAGKSSMINARLIPKLEAKKFREPAEGGGYKERPMYKVYPVARVGGTLPPGISADTVQNIYVFNTLLSVTGGRNAKALVSETLKSYLVEKEPDKEGGYRARYLIIDQFEEILTTHLDRFGEREGFFKQLQTVLDADSKLNVVLTMREDHIAGLDRYTPLLSDGLRNRFRMERLKSSGAIEAIRKPAEIGGRPFLEGVSETLVKDLCRIHVADVERAGNGSDEANPVYGEFVDPVQLQIVCHRLWDGLDQENPTSITKKHLEKFGDIDEALRKFYDGTVERVAKETEIGEGQIRRWFGESLITSSHIRAQVNQGRFSSAGLSSKAVDKLLSSYLIRTEDARGGKWIELSHDRFIVPILESNNEWLSQGQSLLAQSAKAWFDHKNDASYLLRGKRLIEAQKNYQSKMDSLSAIEREFLIASINAQLRQSRGTKAIIFIMFCGLVIIGFLWIQARREAKEARIARRYAEEKSKLAEQKQGEYSRVFNILVKNSYLQSEQATNIFTHSKAFDEFVKVNDKRQEVLSSASQSIRSAITIQYFYKDKDPEIVKASLQELGYNVQMGSSDLDEVPTNCIWFSQGINKEEIRLVALTLVRAGIQIKEIRPFIGKKSDRLIQIGGKKALLGRSNLTIDEISNYSIPES